MKSHEAELTVGKKRLLCIAAAVFAAAFALVISLRLTESFPTVMYAVRTVTAATSVFFIAFIDLKLMVIPNKAVLAMLIAVVIMLVTEAIVDFDTFYGEIIWSFIGVVVMGGIFLAVKLISKNGVGMGDVKLVSVLALYLDFSGIVGALFWAMALMIIVGIVLMLLKKAKLKTRLAMAPFVFFGIVLSNILYVFTGI